LLLSERTWPRREEAIKTSGRGTQTRYATLRSKPSSWGGRQEQVLLNNAGWKARKHLATEMYLFLIPLYRTYQMWNTWSGEKYCPQRSSILLSSEFVDGLQTMSLSLGTTPGHDEIVAPPLTC
jgi:hypothetical protein